ncbi:hypothetical protein PG999_002952 [Apiospora kogelbergensis]|uniref:Cytochrome P450 n=1 Tax=Apiospora kogelbergensis TaxID=1337665 RepID=A0AAW0R9M2_9PEZI
MRNLPIGLPRLGKPIAQILSPALGKPLIILEDQRGIEDILLRRNREFDKAPIAINTLKPMLSNATTGQYTTPELRAQKRLRADVMSAEFLHKAPFKVIHDFQNAALDAKWVAIVGEEPGVTEYEISKLQNQLAGGDNRNNPAPPCGVFPEREVDYIADVVAKNASSPFPGWAQKLETYTPRHRQFRKAVNTEIAMVINKAVERFQRQNLGKLEAEEMDTCMTDMVLRRLVLAAKETGRPLADPAKDPRMLEETVLMLVTGYDTTANVLTWFVRYMESYPAAQAELRAALETTFSDSRVPSMEDILV